MGPALEVLRIIRTLGTSALILGSGNCSQVENIGNSPLSMAVGGHFSDWRTPNWKRPTNHYSG